jgi:hypothetical protein
MFKLTCITNKDSERTQGVPLEKEIKGTCI